MFGPDFQRTGVLFVCILAGRPGLFRIAKRLSKQLASIDFKHGRVLCRRGWSESRNCLNYVYFPVIRSTVSGWITQLGELAGRTTARRLGELGQPSTRIVFGRATSPEVPVVGDGRRGWFRIGNWSD